jgi:hypothetical protein
VQTQLTERNLHLHLDNIHLECRHFISENNLLLQQWIDLFEYTEGDENEVFLIMLIELFEVITEYFLRISLSEAISKIKEAIPRTKSKLYAAKYKLCLKDLKGRQKEMETNRDLCIFENENVAVLCGKCKQVCTEDPECVADQSIACDSCNNWYHYPCMGINKTYI